MTTFLGDLDDVTDLGNADEAEALRQNRLVRQSHGFLDGFVDRAVAEVDVGDVKLHICGGVNDMK